MMDRAERTSITADMVVKELAKLGFSNLRDYIEWRGENVILLDSEALTEEQAACVAEVVQTTSQHGGSIKFKLHNKKGSLELLGRHLGMFTDNLNVNTKGIEERMRRAEARMKRKADSAQDGAHG